MIRIYDYVKHNQPATFDLLCERFPVRKPATMVSVWVDDMPFEMWRRLMTEKPRSGVGGLLPGETKEAVGL